MDFKWINNGEINISENRIEILAPAQVTFFATTAASGRKGSRRRL